MAKLSFWSLQNINCLWEWEMGKKDGISLIATSSFTGKAFCTEVSWLRWVSNFFSETYFCMYLNKNDGNLLNLCRWELVKSSHSKDYFLSFLIWVSEKSSWSCFFKACCLSDNSYWTVVFLALGITEGGYWVTIQLS